MLLIGAAVVVAGFLTIGGAVRAQTDTPVVAPADPSLLDLNQQISEHRQKVQELEQQAQAFEGTIRAKEREAITLSNEVSRLGTQLEQSTVNLEVTATEIATIGLEISLIEKQLTEKEDEIAAQRERLSSFLRRYYREQQRSMLEVAVVEQSFSKFFSALQYLTQMQSDVELGLNRLVALRHDLRVNQEDLGGKRAELETTKERLEVQRQSLDEQKAYQDRLLTQTQSSQAEFEKLLGDIRSEADAINAEISTLERRVREQLGENPEEGILGTGPLRWPVDSNNGISAYFRDPTYPFRCIGTNRNCIGEHSAIDIRVPPGTPVKAASDGYVAIARRLDWIRNAQGEITRSAYNYVTIIHGDGLATVYGHLSSVKVIEDTFVSRGDVIGLSGALPGTAGAGVWTTGPHLHFEVRENGIPVDPLGYLQ
ncbi:MAG: peptidoglycan DD-metalloendopeptidase family protein [Candidatus Kerfeldbacteria bacterium]|nr:peptidoglycan DD-metalloendopeptidase family protein [Candidatus Kerfeldbacteria bacterium]